MKIETRRDRERARRQPEIAPTTVTRPPTKPLKLRPLLYAAGLGALAFIGTLFQEMAYGQILIAMYGVIAVIARIPSDQTFKVSLVTLTCILLLISLGNLDIAKSFASYTFLLFAVGILTAALEQRRLGAKERGSM